MKTTYFPNKNIARAKKIALWSVFTNQANNTIAIPYMVKKLGYFTYGGILGMMVAGLIKLLFGVSLGIEFSLAIATISLFVGERFFTLRR